MNYDKIEGKRRVDRIIIEPMLSVFVPRREYDEAKIDAVLEMYRDKLWRYDEDSLRLAWETVTDQVKTDFWPPFGAFKEAAERAANSRRKLQPQLDNITEGKREMSWERRDRLVKERMDAYMERYERNPLYQEAIAGGWHLDLRRFVQEHAYVQSQIIEGCPHVGFATEPFEHLITQKGKDTAANVMFRYRQTITEQVQCGAVDVAIPARVLQRWRQKADNAMRQAA